MTVGFVFHFPFWVSAILGIIFHLLFWTVIILAGLLLAGFVYWAPGYLLKSAGIADVFSSLSFPTVIYSYCVTNFGIYSEPRSMGTAIASWRARPPISVALLQSSYERGVQAAMADPLGW
jgi:hypothetical protein